VAHQAKRGTVCHGAKIAAAIPATTPQAAAPSMRRVTENGGCSARALGSG
jgi:hypothetical protein